MDDDRDELERYRYNCPNVVNFIRMLGVLAERPGEIHPLNLIWVMPAKGSEKCVCDGLACAS